MDCGSAQHSCAGENDSTPKKKVAIWRKSYNETAQTLFYHNLYKNFFIEGQEVQYLKELSLRFW